MSHLNLVPDPPSHDEPRHLADWSDPFQHILIRCAYLHHERTREAGTPAWNDLESSQRHAACTAIEPHVRDALIVNNEVLNAIEANTGYTWIGPSE